MNTTTVNRGQPTTAPADTDRRTGPGDRVRQALSPRKVGGLYVLALIVLYFSVTVSATFPQWDTVRQILNGNAVSAMAALALIIPMSAGVFDISVAFTMSLSGVLAAWVVVHTGLPLPVAVALAVLAAVGVGIVNGVVVVVMRIDSLIATLATGSLIAAVITMVTHDNSISDAKLNGSFSQIAQRSFHGLTVPILYALVMAVAIWHLQQHTATGRRLYAVGFNRDATRLAGINTEVLRFATLVVSATLAGFSGVVLASSIGSGSPTAGTPYLLYAFAAVFLGATQLKEGRFNAWGTIIAVLLLGTGTTGLGLAGAAAWARSMFTGIVLIAALAVTGLQRRGAGGSGRRRWWKRRGAEPDVVGMASLS
jgi:ribose/xylose/arabinose/galactoside ABC-type transport system permease subunit